MQVEIRADGVHIEGYVNVPGRESKPVITSKGQKVIEVIEPRAFQRALDKVDNVPMTLDHDKSRVLAQTKDSTIELREDNIGLKAKAIVTDPEVIDGARHGKLKGWSFGMTKIVDSIEQRADGLLPLRHVKDFVLDHVTLVMKKNPAYSATSVELRAGEEEPEEIETRSDDVEINVIDSVGKSKVNLSQYKNRINKLKVGI